MHGTTNLKSVRLLYHPVHSVPGNCLHTVWPLSLFLPLPDGSASVTTQPHSPVPHTQHTSNNNNKWNTICRSFCANMVAGTYLKQKDRNLFQYVPSFVNNQVHNAPITKQMYFKNMMNCFHCYTVQ